MKAALRFEVFKRDRFTCTYCGKSPPNVLLEVDHVLPRSAGGTDVIENLTTACYGCNRGKGAKLLEQGSSAPVSAEAVTNLRERNKQARAYAQLVREERELIDESVQDVIECWAQHYQAAQVDGQWTCSTYFPERPSIARYIRAIGLHSVLEAVDIAAARFPYSSGATPSRYFYGVCRNMQREREEVEENGQA